MDKEQQTRLEAHFEELKWSLLIIMIAGILINIGFISSIKSDIYVQSEVVRHKIDMMIESVNN